MSPFRLTVLAAAAIVPLVAGPARAADKVTFLTSWFAQAEHGGFYQAKATGLYRKGGSRRHHQDGRTAGQRHAASAGRRSRYHDRATTSRSCTAVSKGLPVITVGVSFQKDLQGIMTHADVKDLGDLKGKTILIATSGRTSWWPWLKHKFGYSELAAAALHLQPAAVLRRRQHRPAILSVVRAVSGHAEGRAGQLLPVRRLRISALRHHHGHHDQIPERASGRRPAASSRRRWRAGKAT